MADDGGSADLGMADDGGTNLHETDEYKLTTRDIANEHVIISIAEHCETDYKDREQGVPNGISHHHHNALTTEEKQLLLSQLDLLEIRTFQQNVMNELLSLYPSLTDSFSMSNKVQNIATILLTMIRDGYKSIATKPHNALSPILKRHVKYNIPAGYIKSSFKIILKNVTSDPILSNDKKLLQQTQSVWTKANHIMERIVDKAYNDEVLSDIPSIANRLKRGKTKRR
eukprot:288613_1